MADSQFTVPAADSVVASVEEAFEGVPELGAEDGVDDGVQGRVEVAEPQEQRYDIGWEPAPVVNREKDSHDEKG